MREERGWSTTVQRKREPKNEWDVKGEKTERQSDRNVGDTVDNRERERERREKRKRVFC